MGKRARAAADVEYVALQLQSLTELLIERGVITRQDLQRKMREVDLDDDAVDGGLHIEVLRKALRDRPR